MSHIYKKVNSQIVNVEILRNSVFGGWEGRKSWLGSVSPVIVWLVIIYFEARLWEWPLEYPWQYPSEVQVSHSELHVRLLRINAFWFMALSIELFLLAIISHWVFNTPSPSDIHGIQCLLYMISVSFKGGGLVSLFIRKMSRILYEFWLQIIFFSSSKSVAITARESVHVVFSPPQMNIDYSLVSWS